MTSQPTQIPQPADPFGDVSRPSVSFKDAAVGFSVTGKVVKAPEVVQARDFDSGKPAFWDDGNPRLTVVTVLEVDGEERGLWAPKGMPMYRALAEAQKAAGSQIAPGGTLTVTLSGEEPNKDPKKNPLKIYSARYAPADAFGSADTSQPAPAQEMPAPAATKPTAAALSDEDLARFAQWQASQG